MGSEGLVVVALVILVLVAIAWLDGYQKANARLAEENQWLRLRLVEARSSPDDDFGCGLLTILLLIASLLVARVLVGI